MIKLPLVGGSPCLHFVNYRTMQKRKGKVLCAKIDTGAHYLMIPVKCKDFFHPGMKDETRNFVSASGHGFKGRKGVFYAKIQNIGSFLLSAYFYEGERILFGINELSRVLSFCIDKSSLYVCSSDKKFLDRNSLFGDF